MTNLFAKLLTVFGLAAVELWVAIPAGIAMKLDAVVTGVVAAAGGITGVLVAAFLGQSVRAWLTRRHKGRAGDGNSGSKRYDRVRRIWERYGVVGLGLLTPLLFGGPLGTAMGLALGAPARRLVFWIGMGIILWSALLTVAGSLGLAGIRRLM